MAPNPPEHGTYSSIQSTSNMSVNQSVIDQLTAVEQRLKAELNSVEQRLMAELKRVVAEPSAPSASAKKPRAKKDPKPEPSGEKAPLSGWNLIVANTVEEMKSSGWSEWTDADGELCPASRLETVTDKKGVSSEIYVFDGGKWDGKPPSWAQGMKRASYLKAQADPVAAEKRVAYRAKVDEKQAEKRASSTGSAEKKEPVADEKVESVAEEKPKKKQSEETKQKRAATIAAKKAAEAAEAAAAVAAVAAVAEDVIEDVESEAEAAEPEPVKVVAKVTPKPAPVPVAAPKKIVKTAPKAAKKPVSLVMVEWVHEEEVYKKNERGDVADMDGNFFGHWDGKEIDESASQPADWDNAELFFPPSE